MKYKIYNLQGLRDHACDAADDDDNILWPIQINQSGLNVDVFHDE